jgi:hypothetical protein
MLICVRPSLGFGGPLALYPALHAGAAHGPGRQHSVYPLPDPLLPPAEVGLRELHLTCLWLWQARALRATVPGGMDVFHFGCLPLSLQKAELCPFYYLGFPLAVRVSHCPTRRSRVALPFQLFNR